MKKLSFLCTNVRITAKNYPEYISEKSELRKKANKVRRSFYDILDKINLGTVKSEDS